MARARAKASSALPSPRSLASGCTASECKRIVAPLGRSTSTATGAAPAFPKSHTSWRGCRRLRRRMPTWSRLASSKHRFSSAIMASRSPGPARRALGSRYVFEEEGAAGVRAGIGAGPTARTRSVRIDPAAPFAMEISLPHSTLLWGRPNPVESKTPASLFCPNRADCGWHSLRSPFS